MKRIFLGLLAVCFLVSACEDKEGVKAKGTSDGGGGIVKTATEADIRSALPSAYEILTQEGFFMKILASGAHKATQNASDAEGKLFISAMNDMMFPMSLVYAQVKPLKEDATDEELDVYFAEIDQLKAKYPSNDLKDYLKMEKISFAMNGSCPASDKSDAYASVTSYDLEAQVCLSMEKLKTLPQESIVKYITSLLAHELTHMFGYQEKTAELVESAVILGFNDAMGSSAQNIPFKLYGSLLMISSSFQNIQFMIQGRLSFFHEDMTPASQADEVRYMLGYLMGAAQSFESIFNEDGVVTKIFYSKETKGKQEEILSRIANLGRFIRTSMSLSDEQIISPEFEAAVADQILEADEMIKLYREILDFYQM